MSVSGHLSILLTAVLSLSQNFQGDQIKTVQTPNVFGVTLKFASHIHVCFLFAINPEIDARVLEF